MYLLAAGVIRKDAGTESHNSLSETALYHIFERVCMDHTYMEGETVLKLAANACNDTTGPIGLALVILLFEVMSSMPIHPDDLPT